MKMRLLILGSEGFIGQYCVQHFMSKDFEIVGCDLYEVPARLQYRYHKVSRLSPEWEEVFSMTTFDYCINAAGSGNVSYSMTHPVLDFEANTLDVIRILEAIRKNNNHCKYIHLSSAAVYGNPPSLPVREDFTLKPLSAYGWHKLMSEQICKEYQTVFNVKTAILRPFSVYGNGLKKQLLWDICKKIHDSERIELFGTGMESRDFIHVQDLIRLIELVILKSEFKADIYNAATGVETSIRNVADLFEKYIGTGKEIIFNGEVRKGDPLNWRANTDRIKQLGFEPTESLEQGIQDYIKWYQKSR